MWLDFEHNYLYNFRIKSVYKSILLLYCSIFLEAGIMPMMINIVEGEKKLKLILLRMF